MYNMNIRLVGFHHSQSYNQLESYMNILIPRNRKAFEVLSLKGGFDRLHLFLKTARALIQKVFVQKVSSSQVEGM